jgi:hypothetical protein
MVTEAHPLQWPNGWTRTQYPTDSRFGSYSDKPTIGAATEKIVYEMRLFGGTDLIISTDLKLRKDGLPYSSQRQPEDRGVAVYFTYQNEQKVIACDSFNKIGCNLWAIAKTIEAMRGIDRWGCSEIITKAFTGFTALPESTNENIWSILEINPTFDQMEIRKAYKKLAKKYHPDITGDDTHFKKIQEAYKIAIK